MLFHISLEMFKDSSSTAVSAPLSLTVSLSINPSVFTLKCD